MIFLTWNRKTDVLEYSVKLWVDLSSQCVLHSWSLKCENCSILLSVAHSTPLFCPIIVTLKPDEPKYLLVA